MEMPELLDENIFDILSRLPVKSLMRFKCVSKPWCSLISDPQFIKAHSSRPDQMSSKIILSTQPQASIMDDEGCENSIVELNYPIPVQKWVKFVGSRNGLVCLLFNSYTFMLWNASTRKFRQSPPHIPSDIYDPDGRSGCRDPPHYYGFGYDSSIDDYKLVVGFWPKPYGANICPIYYVVQVFALKSNKWKFIRFDNVRHYFQPFQSGIFFNGNLHWISGDRYGKPRVVLSFNIEEEKFMEVVPLPADCHAQSYQMRLNSFENSLFLCTIHKNADVVEDSWKILYRVRTEVLWTPTNYQLYFTKKHKLVLGVLKDTIHIYDLEAGTCKALQSENAYLDMIVDLETLVSPN